MAEQIIEIEADSLEDVRRQISSQIPEGFGLLSERIISDGKPQTVKAIAETSEAAFAKAQGEIPDNASILERKELTAPERKVIIVEAPDEQEAESSVRWKARVQFGNTAIVKGIKLAVRGSKGFIGIGAKPNQYEAEILQQAVVEITYRTKARISAQVGRSKTTQLRNLAQQARSLASKVRGHAPAELQTIAHNLDEFAAALERGTHSDHSIGQSMKRMYAATYQDDKWLVPLVFMGGAGNPGAISTAIGEFFQEYEKLMNILL